MREIVSDHKDRIQKSTIHGDLPKDRRTTFSQKMSILLTSDLLKSQCESFSYDI